MVVTVLLNKRTDHGTGHFSAIPPFGFSVTTDHPLFCSPENQVIPPKIPPPHPRLNGPLSITTQQW